ncbi:MAG: peptidase [Firmicutes bacterium]|nr:peptidase [Bacillota bacterium]
MITRGNKAGGYRRAAAGVMSCLLVGGALGLPLHRRQPATAVAAGRAVALTPGPSMPPMPSAPAPMIDGASVTADGPYVTVRSGGRELFAATGAAQPKAYAYTVREGESLWDIAESLGTDTATLTSLNPAIDPELLRPGQTLQVVERFHGLAYTVEAGDSLEQIALQYGAELERIEAANGLSAEAVLAEGRTLLLPDAQARPRTLVASRGDAPRERSAAPAAVSTPQPETEKTAGDSNWRWPINGGTITSEFGARWGGFHTGIDIAVAIGTQAVAARAGTVVFSGWDGGYGYCVIIDHGGGVKSRYAHASVLLVSTGDTVAQGTPVIQVGTTGHSTGPHLHFEVIVDGTAQNPRNFLH